MIGAVLYVVQGARVGGCHNVRLSPVVGERPEWKSKDEWFVDLTSHLASQMRGSLKAVFQEELGVGMHCEIRLTIEQSTKPSSQSFWEHRGVRCCMCIR
jgi:hypothetical protein